MASGPESEAAEQPPALPVKQRRSRSSGCSSVDSNWFRPSTAEEQNQYQASNDVFHEPADSTDCQVKFCPIHQCHGPSRHQVRFFSDQTPPLVPKKKLARTLSLPTVDAPPLSPLLPLRRQPQSFDTPLSMLGHVPKTFFHDEGTLNFILSLSQLSFDTPDEELSHIFRNFEEQKVVFQGIQHRQTLFLQSVAQSIDAGILLQEERGDHPYLPQDFLLCEESTKVGDTVFYSLRSPKLPERQLALRVHKQTDQRPPTHAKPQHFNVQHTLAHFQTPNKANSSPHEERNPACSVTIPPAGGSSGAIDHDVTSLHSLLLGGCSVSVERDQPHLTLEEFVQKSNCMQNTSSVDYHRQLCVLLLQIVTGSQHLYTTSRCAAALRPAEVMLVWPPRDQEGRGDVQGLNTNHINSSHSLRRRGSPRVVLSPDSSSRYGPHLLSYIKTQIGALIQYCLCHQESLTSTYQHGLLQLASALQTEHSGLQMGDAVATFQVLLWGPRQSLLDHRLPMSSTVQNWLTTKRALLVLKLAERGLVQDQSPLDWEDSLCLKYLSSTDSEVVARTVAWLWPPLHVD